MAKKTNLGSAKRFGPRYGRRNKEKVAVLEMQHRGRHKCPFCNYLKLKRFSVGIWQCEKCKAKFAGKAYTSEMSKKSANEALKEEPTLLEATEEQQTEQEEEDFESSERYKEDVQEKSKKKGNSSDSDDSDDSDEYNDNSSDEESETDSDEESDTTSLESDQEELENDSDSFGEEDPDESAEDADEERVRRV
jgi:large subunit ribosomal protein L37Ae